MALLPVGERYALVWTATPREAERLLALDDAAFVAELQARFGDRAGRFQAPGPRASFPLRLRVVNTPIARRAVVVGNAAQALHPIAGQGLNLGLRDAAHLAEVLEGAGDPGAADTLATYRDARRRDSIRGGLLHRPAGVRVCRRPPWSYARTGSRARGPRSLRAGAPVLADRMIHGAPALERPSCRSGGRRLRRSCVRLCRAGFEVRVIEAAEHAPGLRDEFDVAILALSAGTRDFLRDVGAWERWTMAAWPR
jgi:2-octaprenyl-6-methoxyphenol hydroxylase